MKIITKKQQKEIDKMIIKKLRFVARATLENFALIPEGRLEDSQDNEDTKRRAMQSAEAVFYADDVI